MSDTTVLDSHPHNQEADYLQDENAQKSIIAFRAIMLFFVTLFLAFRIYTRRFVAIQKKLTADDFGEYYTEPIGAAQLIRVRKLQIANEWLYIVLCATIRTAALLHYERIFHPYERLRRILYTAMILVNGLYLILLIVSVVKCRPVSRSWDVSVKGERLPMSAIAYSSAGLNVLSSLFVLGVPMPVLWGLQMKIRKKIMIMSVYGASVIVVVMSIARLSLTPSSLNNDSNSMSFDYIIVSVLELDLSVICVCFLVLPTFLDKMKPRIKIKLRWIGYQRQTSSVLNTPDDVVTLPLVGLNKAAGGAGADDCIQH
ncbi:hypothetical protein GLAREA_10545 [Glarea lozoyensis ATCC 20868]|uniref:Rhodopsin domain-containing protein n=2 Tax=Glarea lozoyensis TaxID=101852 RepID=S3DAW7_GLAL2|nr:uncharacterized protein GLAREA_10545 [Glarea lozoyensis ATCC 20868]EPE34850.1 hypothetical protein GLAREA_10545 [Glarea lozoyensis ATCC 20868]